jgi:hypothetical protein
LDAEGAQVCEGCEALELGDAVLAEPEGCQVCEGFQAFDLADAVGAEFEVGQVREGFEVLDARDAVLDKVEVVELREVRDVLDVLELVVAEVEAGEGGAVLEAVRVLDQVVVEFELDELGREGFRELDLLDGVLAQAEFFEVLEAFEAEAGYVCDARVLCVNLLLLCKYLAFAVSCCFARTSVSGSSSSSKSAHYFCQCVYHLFLVSSPRTFIRRDLVHGRRIVVLVV